MFLKPLMLAGLGAAVIPLALHLLSKARYRSIDWGAMMFLEQSRRSTAQSTRLKQATLLLLRTAIIVALALALARPVLHAANGAAGEEARIHAIIILDRSASMGFSENAHSRMADAKQAVIHILSSLHRGDEVSLILTGDPVDPGQAQPTSDLQSVATRIGALQPSYGRADIAAALEQARLALAREPGVTHELYIVCDRQALSWENVNDKFATAWQKTQEQSNSALRFFVLPVGGDESDNIAIESIRVPGPPIIRDLPAPVEVHLRNYGSILRSNLPLTILVNGKPIATSSVNVAPDSSSVVTSWVRFPSSGSQVLSARVTSDGMRADDQIDDGVDVLDPARVLIITGEARRADLTSADYIRLALSPYESSGQKGVDPANVRIISADDWWGISPDRDDVVILTDIGQLSDDQVRQVEQFVYGGGSVVFAPGNLTDLESANNDLYREGEGFLPGSFKLAEEGAGEGSGFRVQGSGNANAPVAAPLPAPKAPSSLNPEPRTLNPSANPSFETNHPIFEFLHDHADAFSNAQVYRSLELDDRSSDARVIATLANGKPLMVERPYGRGRVILFTTTLGTEWNALPTTREYLPLMQSVVRYLAGTTLPDRNLKPFQPIELSFDHPPAQAVATIALPNGQQRRVPVVQTGQRWTMRFDETGQPGRYIVSFQGGSSSNYVVGAPRDESDPAPLTDERWAWLQGALKFQRLDSDKDALTAAVASQRTGRELHLPLMGCVMLMALGEMALARMWSKQT